MALITFNFAHKHLDNIGIPRLNEYTNNVKIIEKFDFAKQEKAGDVEWREDGVYIKINGAYQKGFMYNKDYRVSDFGNPKFHLFECSVIEKFIVKGILSRYYFWSNSDTVTVTQRGAKLEYKKQKLDLCAGCRYILQDRELGSIRDTEEFYNLLDVNDKNIENNLDNIETDIFNRPLNWNEISKAYREEQNYTCEECSFGNTDLKTSFDRRYIHTHHINSFELTNTHRNNLKSLCILCHYNQDDHHQSNFEKPRLRIQLESFIHSYKERLLEIKNPYIVGFLSSEKPLITT